MKSIRLSVVVTDILLMAVLLAATLAVSAGPAMAQSGCVDGTGGIHSSADDAKAAYINDCGRPFEHTPEFSCTWVPGGWQCSGPANSGGSSSNDAGATPSADARLQAPSLDVVSDEGRYNSVVWRSNSSLDGVNVYRNDKYVGSVNAPNNVFNDYRGNAGDVYYVVGYNDANLFSDRSSQRRATGVATLVEKVRWHQDVVSLSWDGADGDVLRYMVYRDGALVGVSASTSWVDYNADSTNTYTIKTVDRGYSVGRFSADARYPFRLTSRSGQAVTPGNPQTFSLELAPDRTFVGTMSVDNQTGVSFEGNIVDDRGNNLGTVSQRHDGVQMVTEVVPAYGQAHSNHWVGDPMELNAGAGGHALLADSYPSAPRVTITTDGGGDGGGDGGDGFQGCPCSNSLTEHEDPGPGGDPEDYSGGAG